MAAAERANMGGGFIEFLFGDAPQGGRYQQQDMYQQQPDVGFDGRRMPQSDPNAAEPVQRSLDPRYNKQMVDYHGKEGTGTVVIDTPNKFLYLVQGDGKALRVDDGIPAQVGEERAAVRLAAPVGQPEQQPALAGEAARQVGGDRQCQARVAQHELDHLDGLLIIERTDAESRREALATLRHRPVL